MIDGVIRLIEALALLLTPVAAITAVYFGYQTKKLATDNRDAINQNASALHENTQQAVETHHAVKANTAITLGIDDAVNGREPGGATIAEDVRDLVERADKYETAVLEAVEQVNGPDQPN